ncbi:MAG TPA: hypothetical protein VMZ22_00465 [Acidimicrobiales bacterium]|nr:hypothetical protein [Acidimicrobiales bacterium]
MAMRYDERPDDDTPVSTAELPATPVRDRNIKATAWREAPPELLRLGDDLPGQPVADYKRRIGDWLLWRAGPASGGDARYWATDLTVQVTFRLRADGAAEGTGADGRHYTRFRDWKQSLLAKPPLAIVDIDGVVADVRHRVRYVEQRPKDWRRFFAAAEHDEAHAEGLAVVAKLAEEHEVVFLTGRPEHLRADTVAWLRRHGLHEHRLYMRPEGDRGPSARFKVRQLGRLAGRSAVAIVVDDDPMVIEAMRDAGYVTMLADWEKRDATVQASLIEAQEVEGRT